MKIKIFFIALMFLSGIAVKASGDLSNIEAMFIYNFLRHVEWPAGNTSNKFVIGVYGNSLTYDQLVQFTSNRKVGTRAIEVRKFTSIAEAANCQLVFVPHNQISKIAEIKRSIGNKSCLIVGEKEGSNAAGSSIEFVVQNNKLKFRVDENNAKQHNLMVSKALLDMSI
jgi:hypothetical protein